MHSGKLDRAPSRRSNYESSVSMTDQPLSHQGDIPEFHRLTGEAIRAWADIENNMSSFASTLLGVDQFRARIVMGSILGSRGRREFVTRLAETYLEPALLPNFRGLMKRVKTLGRTRNSLAHSLMHINVDGRKNKVFADTFSKEMDGGLDFSSRDLSINDLRVFVQSLTDLHGELLHFMFEFDGKVHVTARVHRESTSEDDTDNQ